MKMYLRAIVLLSIIFDITEDCKAISDIALVGCNTINNEALKELLVLKDNLTRLEINGCMNVTGEGILKLQNLQ